MLKTRLAEKDAQLMGGFGALSNMQLGGAHWLGGLPDPESIAATLPDQARPYFPPHPHSSPPRKSAWGVKHGGGRVTGAHTSSPQATLELHQQLPAIVQSPNVPLAPLTSSLGVDAATGWQSQLKRQSTQDPLAQGLNAASPGALQQPQGSLRKPSQARPVLLPLSASQNGMQLPLEARSSTPSGRDGLQEKSVEASTSVAAAVALESDPTAQAAERVQPSVAVQSSAADDISDSDQSSEAGSESELSETESEASLVAKTPRGQLSDSAAVNSVVRTDQTTAVQQSPVDRNILLVASDSLPAAQASPITIADESRQSQVIRGDDAKPKNKSKWRVW